MKKDINVITFLVLILSLFFFKSILCLLDKFIKIYTRVKKFPCEVAELLLPMTTLTAKQYIELYSLWVWSDIASDFCCLFACNTFYIKVKKIIRKLGCALSQNFFFLFVEKERTQPLTWDRLTEESVISYCFSSSSFSFRSNE